MDINVLGKFGDEFTCDCPGAVPILPRLVDVDELDPGCGIVRRGSPRAVYVINRLGPFLFRYRDVCRKPGVCPTRPKWSGGSLASSRV